MNSLKDMVSGGKQVEFICYENEQLWYKTECGFEFSVPQGDTGDGAFLPIDKASYFMRWIKRQLDSHNIVNHDIVLNNKDNQLDFVRYQQKELWYSTKDGFIFPIDIQSIAHETMWKSENVSKLESWINLYALSIEEAKKEHISNP